MSNNNKELIVQIKEERNNPDCGVLDIIFVSSDNGRNIELPLKSEFLTGGIFISKQFEVIKNKFKEGELFRLQKWEQNIDSNLDYSSEHHDWWAYGNESQSIEMGTFIPIYNGKLPELSTGFIDIPNLPVNKAFFISDSNDVYGPFTAKAEVKYENRKASPYNSIALSIERDSILKISHKVLKDNKTITPPLDTTDLQYIISLRALSAIPKEDREDVDFISDEELIRCFSKLGMGKNKVLHKKEAEKLKTGVADSIKKRELKEGDDRVIRLKEILDQYLSEADIGKEIITDYLNSEKGKDYLSCYIEKKPSFANKASDEIKESIEIQEEKLKQLINDSQKKIIAQNKRVETAKLKANQEVEKAKNGADREIEKIRKKSKEDLEREEQKVIGSLKADIIELEDNKDKLQKQFARFIKENDEITNFKDLQDENIGLERQNKRLERSFEKKRHLLSAPADLGEKMTEIQTLIDLLQGRSLNQRDEQYEFKSPKITATLPDQANQYIQTLVEYFENDGYSITFDEITNLLINIQQSFLTVLAGLPGSGKTSTVMRLGISQGLCSQSESNSDCFLNIPVARGWVSSRDFVGFNNSLKGIFQPAKTGIYQFLRQSEQPKANDVLRMVLLDEANLSPIEHYWSEFLAMCDKEGRHRPLDTGVQNDRRYLKVANNIRFIATINNDNTTEPLSPRLCDRAPIITMDAPQIESAEQHIASLSLEGAIPYEVLNEWFGIPIDSDLTIPSLIDDFCKLMKTKNSDFGAEIYISHRKLNAMAAYCKTANKYIEDNIVPIDFALSQHALPLINGHGKEFRNRLESLENLAKNNNLKRTSALLQNILKAGETYIDSYSFF